MRDVNTRRHVFSRAWFPLGLLAGMALAGCGGPREHTSQGTQLAPGADAHISADTDSDAALTRLAVDVYHLAPPDRIEAKGKHFVVWQRPNVTTPWRRVGVLEYDADNRTGRLAGATVPYTKFELLVSVENQSDPSSPSSSVVIGPTSID